LYLATGIINIAVVKQAAVLFPFMPLGLFLGMKGSRYIAEKTVKKFMNIMLIISGAALIINNIWK